MTFKNSIALLCIFMLTFPSIASAGINDDIELGGIGQNSSPPRPISSSETSSSSDESPEGLLVKKPGALSESEDKASGQTSQKSEKKYSFLALIMTGFYTAVFAFLLGTVITDATCPDVPSVYTPTIDCNNVCQFYQRPFHQGHGTVSWQNNAYYTLRSSLSSDNKTSHIFTKFTCNPDGTGGEAANPNAKGGTVKLDKGEPLPHFINAHPAILNGLPVCLDKRNVTARMEIKKME